MARLEDTVNIGEVLAGELHRAGIATADDLHRVGARAAWGRIQRINPDRDCASSLLALEGAVRGVRWVTIPEVEREEIAAYAHSRRRRP
jgi:DNA transformation protein